jgi:hypothetical protein
LHNHTLVELHGGAGLGGDADTAAGDGMIVTASTTLLAD